MNTNTMATVFILVALAVLLIACTPIALIWAVNTLFGTAIQVTLKTWGAALILSAPFAYSSSKK